MNPTFPHEQDVILGQFLWLKSPVYITIYPKLAGR